LICFLASLLVQRGFNELNEFESALETAAMACSESHNCDLARIGGISRRSLDMLR
jgi:hypothetical protein